MRSVDTIIIGGGISGAAVLHFLSTAGKEVVLLEKNERLGGVMESRQDAHGLIEYGPSSAMLGPGALEDLIRDVKLEDRLIEASSAAKNRYVVKGGKLVAVPSGPGEFIRSPLFSAQSKFRLLKEPFIRAGSEADESVADFVERRFGVTALEYGVDPFVAGIYAGRPQDLSLQHTFPRLHSLEQEHGSVVRGMLKSRKAAKSAGSGPRQKARMISFLSGIEELPAALTAKWSERIRFGEVVSGIRKEEAGWIVETSSGAYSAQQIVLATPAYGAAAILSGLDSVVTDALNQIHYPPIATATSIYSRGSVKHPLDGFGALVPSVENRNILGVIFTASLFPQHAPAGWVSLRTFVGGARQPELATRPTAQILADIHSELTSLLGITGRPDFTEIHVWQRSIPQINVGYGRILGAISEFEKQHPGLYLLGNYRGGVSVGDCVKNAKILAETLIRT